MIAEYEFHLVDDAVRAAHWAHDCDADSMPTWADYLAQLDRCLDRYLGKV